MKTTATLVFAALQLAAIANAQTYTIQRIGLTDPLHTIDGSSTNNWSDLNASGQVTGSAERYSGSTDEGVDAWLYSAMTHTSQVIGLPGAPDSYLDNEPVQLNASGQVIGIRYHVDASNLFTGSDAWIYSPTTNTTQMIGLTDAAHTQTDGTSTNQVYALNATGQVAGFAVRNHYDGYFGGDDIWIYSSPTHTTQSIGLTGPGYSGAFGGPYGSTDSRFIAQNAAGYVIGRSSYFLSSTPGQLNDGDPWLYSPITQTTTRIGMYDAIHEEGNLFFLGARSNNAVALNASGQVAGTANHYQNVHGMLPYNGQDAWIFTPTTNVTQQIGLVDSNHTQSGGYTYHKPVAINDSGQIAGYSSRFSGQTDLGQDAWVYSSTTNSTQPIGLTDGGHMQVGGYLFNQPTDLNAAGEVVGFAKRYNGSADQGQDAWFYSPTTNTTQLIGLTDKIHTQVGGTSVNNTMFLNAAGLIVGTAKRYNGNSDPSMSSDNGIDSWLFDPVSRVTYNLVSSLSATGFASSTVSYLGDNGLVLGSYNVNGGATQDAFLWTEAAGFHDLGDLIQGGLTAAGWANLADALGGDGGAVHHRRRKALQRLGPGFRAHSLFCAARRLQQQRRRRCGRLRRVAQRTRHDLHAERLQRLASKLRANCRCRLVCGCHWLRQCRSRTSVDCAVQLGGISIREYRPPISTHPCELHFANRRTIIPAFCWLLDLWMASAVAPVTAARTVWSLGRFSVVIGFLGEDLPRD